MQVLCSGDREVFEGYDGPHHLHAACRRTIDFDPEPWDVKTDDGGNVVERHKDMVCPFCGTRTFVLDPTLPGVTQIGSSA